MRGLVVLGGVVLIAGLGAWLTIANGDRVTVHLLVGSIADVPLWAVLLGSFLTGGGVVAGVLTWPYLRLRLRVRSQARQITRLEQEVHGLRTLPLPDEATGTREI